jgi:putative transposase
MCLPEPTSSPVEVLTWRGLVTYYVLVFLHLETRRVNLAGITRHPTGEWMTQMARNAVDEESGYLRRHRYVLHDRDAKFCADFRKTLATGGVKCLRLPARSPNLNAFAERWVRAVKSGCLCSVFKNFQPARALRLSFEWKSRISSTS